MTKSPTGSMRRSAHSRGSGGVSPSLLLAAQMLLAVALIAAVPAGVDSARHAAVVLGPLSASTGREQRVETRNVQPQRPVASADRAVTSESGCVATRAAWRRLDLPPPSNA